MKTFTKILLSVTLAVVYLTGYGAHLQLAVDHDGIYIPKSPVVHQAGASIWGAQSGQSVAGFFKTDFSRMALHKIVTKTISAPKKYPYQFTANSAPASALGTSLYNAAITWDEGKLKPTLTAYPNPSKGKFTISLAQASNAKYKITVSNTIGNVVKIISVPDSLRNPEINFDLSESPAGIYFYSLYVNDKMVETKRLILQQ